VPAGRSVAGTISAPGETRRVFRDTPAIDRRVGHQACWPTAGVGSGVRFKTDTQPDIETDPHTTTGPGVGATRTRS
jgi:hypothetical protein